MGNSSSAHKISSQDRTILDLKVQRDRLTQYQKRLTLLISDAHAAALAALARKDPRAARLALRRKKHQEGILRRTDAQLAQLENLTADVEMAQVQKAVFEGVKRGTGVLAQIRREMGGVEEVERVMAASEEERERAAEIDGILAGRMTSEEEDEVDEELRRLEQEQEEKAPTKASRERQRLPDAPQGMATEDALPDAPDSIKQRPVEEQNKKEERQALTA